MNNFEKVPNNKSNNTPNTSPSNQLVKQHIRRGSGGLKELQYDPLTKIPLRTRNSPCNKRFTQNYVNASSGNPNAANKNQRNYARLQPKLE